MFSLYGYMWVQGIVLNDTLRGLFMAIPLIPAYVIPCLITLVCIPIQAYYLRKSLSASAISQVSRESDYITVTIILVSSLFVICNIPVFAYALYVWARYPVEEPLLNEFVQFTLPLLNGVGFPLIIILRKPALRDRFTGYILAPIRLLTRTGSVLIARYRGYQEIEQ